jgi:hypothetical protein
MSDHEHEAMSDAPFCKHCGVPVGKFGEVIMAVSIAESAYEPKAMNRKEALKKADDVMFGLGYREMREL